MSLVQGWGALSYGTGQYPDVLMEVEVGVVTNEVCSTAYSGINDNMICAGGVEGQDSCQVSLLVVMRLVRTLLNLLPGRLWRSSDLQHVLIGDVSFGDGCAQAGKYGVYGRISYFRQWIEGKMCSPEYCGSGPDADA